MTKSIPPFHIPEPPTDPESVAGVERQPLRYEDITQDGRLRLEGIWHPTGRLLWSADGLGARLMSLMAEHDVRFVLSRVVLEASGRRIAARVPAETELRSRFEHVRNDGGDVKRLLFSTWLHTRNLPKQGRSEGLGWVARAYGQRILARLDAPPGQRSVQRLTGLGDDGVPPHAAMSVDPSTLLALPEGAEPLTTPRRSPVRAVFGLSHTDLNQHVNFLSYPRYIEQAALTLTNELGLGSRLLPYRAELGYRAPSFAGETVRIVLQPFRLAGELGVVAGFYDDDDGPERRDDFSAFGQARATGRMMLRS